MSVSSSLNSQSVSDQVLYVSDGSDQQWSPDTSTQNIQTTTAVEWSVEKQYDNNAFNGTEALYNVQNNTGIGNYFNMQTNSIPPNTCMNPTYQRRDYLVGNGFYVPNRNLNNTPNISYNNLINTARNTQSVYTNSNYQSLTRSNWNTNKVSSGGVKKPKRVRTAFTTQQMMELELEYARTRYLDRNRRIELSETLHLSEKTIKVWFQNRRMKDKKDRAEGMEDSEATSTTESSPEMNVPQIPQHNFYQNVTPNGIYNQGNMYMDRYSVPITTLENNPVPIPVHNAMVNSYPGYFTSNVNILEATQNTMNPVLQSQFTNTIAVQDKDVAPEFYKNQLECQEDMLIEDNVDLKEESSPQSEKDVNELPKACVNSDTWELSWVRLMDLQE